MKKALAIVSLFFWINTADADSDSNRIGRALVGEVVYAHALCPSNVTCVSDLTAIGINFQLTCSDASFSFNYTVNPTTSSVDIEAIEDLDPGVSCSNPDTEIRFEEITLNGMFLSLTLNFIGTGVSYQIRPENITRDFTDKQKWWSLQDSNL